jgi:hypothetical protein
MRKALAGFLFSLLLPATAGAQHLWIDASQFNKTDICLDIQAAIAALPVSAGSETVVIDARNFSLPPGSGFIGCAVNPFTVLAGPGIVLVGQGSSSLLETVAGAPVIANMGPIHTFGADAAPVDACSAGVLPGSITISNITNAGTHVSVPYVYVTN